MFYKLKKISPKFQSLTNINLEIYTYPVLKMMQVRIETRLVVITSL